MINLSKKSHKKQSENSIILYALHLPVLLLLAVLLAGGGYFAFSSIQNSDAEGKVLSDEDENDDDDEEDEDDESKDEDEEDNDDEGKDEDEDEDEEEDDDDDEFESVETVLNPNGTTSRIKREIRNGEESYEISVYDQSGNKIEETKYEIRDGEEQLESDFLSNISDNLTELRLKAENGQIIRLEIRESATNRSKIRYRLEDQELEIETEDEFEDEDEDDDSRLKIRVDNNRFRIERSGTAAFTRFPMTVDEETGQVFVETSMGSIQLKEMPDVIVQKALASDEIDEIDELEVEAEGTLIYTVTGAKREKLLGLFEIPLETTMFLNAADGELIGIDQSFVTNLLDLISF